MTSIELCPKCHASIALPSPKSSFGEDCARAFQNPTETEVACTKSSLETLPGVMTGLVQEIARVESILIALKAHHAHLDTYIKQNTQYICPSSVRRLPTEVLGIIFASACTSFQRSEYKTPLSISLVCSKWRDIALSAPSLWTHIYIAPHSGGLDVYNHFLKQCGNVPVSVRVDIPYRDRPLAGKDIPFEETHEYHLELVSDLGQTCGQWKVAEFCMNQEDINLLGFDIQALESPLLESLTLENVGPADYHLENALFYGTSSLTNFTVLQSEGHGVDFQIYADALPWRQLREVSIPSDVYSLRDVNDDFEDGKNRTLILRPHLYEVTLPPLTTFSLHISTLVLDSVIWTHALTVFFRAITLPTLESLTMSPPDPYTTCSHFVPAQWTSPFSALPEFLTRSGCALQTFTVIMRGRYEGCTFMFTLPTLPNSLMIALHYMTKLRALRVIEAGSGPSLFSEQLFREMAEHQSLPKLMSLQLVWAEGHQQEDTLIPMLSSRCGQGDAEMNTLSSVVLGVRNGGDLRGDVLECMASLRQQGTRATLW